MVHNGIDTELWHPVDERQDRLVWLGRITHNKGLQEAVIAARHADQQLNIIGAIEDLRYFADEVEPLPGDRIQYLGHLSGMALRHTVAAARAAVVTPL